MFFFNFVLPFDSEIKLYIIATTVDNSTSTILIMINAENDWRDIFLIVKKLISKPMIEMLYQTNRYISLRFKLNIYKIMLT